MAIDDLLDEHEQSERVLGWLRRNGVGLIGGVALGLALIGGWQWWQKHTQNESARAGDQYQSALKALEAKDIKRAETQFVALKDTPYGALAALDLAKAQVESKTPDAAIKTLRGVTSSDAGLQRIVDQRLARLLIGADRNDEALAVIGDANDPASLEVRGDAQAAAGKPEAARKSYSDALTALDVAAPQRRLLELKLSDVGGTPAQPEARS